MGRYHSLLPRVIKVSVLAVACSVSSTLAAPPSATPSAQKRVNSKPTTAKVEPSVKPEQPLARPADVSLPSGAPVYPGARKAPFRPVNSADNHYFFVAKFIATDPFPKVLEFYKEKCERLPVTTVSKRGPFQIAQCWLRDVRRGTYSFRVHLTNPVYDSVLGRQNPKLTQIQYYMESR